MATHSSILAWKIPWTEEPGGIQLMGLQTVRHNWATEHAYLSILSFVCLFLIFIPLSELPGSIVWYLSLILENSWPLLLQICCLLNFLFLLQLFQLHVPHLLKLHSFWMFFFFFFSPVLSLAFRFKRFLLMHLHSHWLFPQFYPASWQGILHFCFSVFDFLLFLLSIS